VRGWRRLDGTERRRPAGPPPARGAAHAGVRPGDRGLATPVQRAAAGFGGRSVPGGGRAELDELGPLRRDGGRRGPGPGAEARHGDDYREGARDGPGRQRAGRRGPGDPPPGGGRARLLDRRRGGLRRRHVPGQPDVRRDPAAGVQRPVPRERDEVADAAPGRPCFLAVPVHGRAGGVRGGERHAGTRARAGVACPEPGLAERPHAGAHHARRGDRPARGAHPGGHGSLSREDPGLRRGERGDPGRRDR